MGSAGAHGEVFAAGGVEWEEWGVLLVEGLLCRETQTCQTPL